MTQPAGGSWSRNSACTTATSVVGNASTMIQASLSGWISDLNGLDLSTATPTTVASIDRTASTAVDVPSR